MRPLIIIGAGAAGLLAAIFAGRTGTPVVLLDARRKPGAKIRVSGGGRCNILPSQVALADFSTVSSPHTLRNILLAWPLGEVRRFFEQDLALPLKDEPTGKVFPCSDNSADVVHALFRAVQAANVTCRFDTRVQHIGRDSQGFAVHVQGGEILRAGRLVVSCGGLSMPTTGSDGGGWRMLKKIGHAVAPTHPALVPLLGNDATTHALAGVATPASLVARDGHKVVAQSAGDVLFTHHGYSGPAILNISRHFTRCTAPATTLRMRLGAGVDYDVLLQQPTAALLAPVLRTQMPRRLASLVISRAGVAETLHVRALARAQRQAVVAACEHLELPVSGSEAYRTAEVTAGGIGLDQIHRKTLESRICPGLHIAGEMLDATGRLGGYNFLWAWVTGRCAGLAAGQAMRACGA